MVGDFSGHVVGRDIVVEHRSKKLKRIHSDNENVMPMQYPLVFFDGKPGYHRKIRYIPDVPGSKNIKRSYVTMDEYYSYRLHPRNNESSILFRSGRLFQQIVVDMYVCVEQDRLNFIERNQSLLRADKLCNIRNAVMEGDMYGRNIGKRIVLPASYVGGPRYMFQNYHDAIALCRRYGPPDLFITFTCNPQWQEVTRALLPGQRPDERPDIVCRIFKNEV
ncbi:hypothetical protein LUZ62_040336 [Rhynchospora pubera]|uniref:Helitron helicase-like domain-containing protein n=1 Tax=Rhynchospora pubera TaxID=906938 RepID=A0AAV8FBT5_9POAL|nr:hypothetical protein LUZ62_040336 [Rhynchospora pubera]